MPTCSFPEEHAAGLRDQRRHFVLSAGITIREARRVVTFKCDKLKFRPKSPSRHVRRAVSVAGSSRNPEVQPRCPFSRETAGASRGRGAPRVCCPPLCALGPCGEPRPAAAGEGWGVGRGRRRGRGAGQGRTGPRPE